MPLYYIKPCRQDKYNVYFPRQLKELHGIFEAHVEGNDILRMVSTNEYLKYNRWYLFERETILLTKNNYKLILRGKKFPSGTLKYIIRRMNDA